MKTLSHNRLLVVGPRAALERFKASQWHRTMQARHTELLETSACRHACQFVAGTAPTAAMQRLSRRFPELVFLLDYEMERSRTKGLAKARAGQLEHWRMRY